VITVIDQRGDGKEVPGSVDLTLELELKAPALASEGAVVVRALVVHRALKTSQA